MGNANRRILKQAQSLKNALRSDANSPSASQPSTLNTVRWSDIVAARKSTHPDAAPIKPILDTTELCEDILLHLPMQDLLQAREVCRTLRNLIDNSPSLQQALFLKADTRHGDLVWVVNQEESLLTGNKALQYLEAMERGGASPTHLHPVIVNPFLLSHTKYTSLHLTYRIPHLGKPGHSEPIVLDKIRSQIDRFDKLTFCRRMYLSQPLVTEVRIEFRGERGFMPWEDRRGLPKTFEDCVGCRVIGDETGVTLGRVIDVVRTGVPCKIGRSKMGGITFLNGFAVSAEEVERRLG